MDEFVFGRASNAQLATVDPRLEKVARLALKLSPIDFSILEGARSVERQLKLYNQGRKTPGPIVTWTKKSRHFVNPLTGFGEALDFLNYPVDYKATKQFLAIAYAFKKASEQLRIPIRWGGDWDGDNIPMEKGETDIGHIELKK